MTFKTSFPFPRLGRADGKNVTVRSVTDGDNGNDCYFSHTHTRTHLQQGLDCVTTGGVDEARRRWTLAGWESEGGRGVEHVDASYCWNAVATCSSRGKEGVSVCVAVQGSAGFSST